MGKIWKRWGIGCLVLVLMAGLFGGCSLLENNVRTVDEDDEDEEIPITQLVMSTNVCELKEGETFQLTCSVYPADADDEDLEWKSTNENVVKVSSNGLLTGVAVGQANVTVSSESGVVAMCSVTVKLALPDFNLLYGVYHTEAWCEVATDGTWIEFDTNPYDYDDEDWIYYYSDSSAAQEQLQVVLEELGFSDSVFEKMLRTTALQGRQTASCEVATASWTYHPDAGLEVLIEVNDN